MQNSNYHVNANRDPDLGADGIGAVAVKVFDPAEEQFHLLTQLVKLGHLQSRQREVVGQEVQSMVGFQIVKTNASQRPREITSASRAGTILITVGIGPRKSSWVCNLIPALVERNSAQPNKLRNREIMVESRA
jgi:hypothetical protein